MFYAWSGRQAAETSPGRFNAQRVLPEEDAKILECRRMHREVGYRKLTWMMNDESVVALSESAAYSVLSKHGLLGPWISSNDGIPVEKEYRHKPSRIHEHWHCDLAYVKIKGVLYFLIMMLDGCPRCILDWDLLTDMTSRSVQDFVQRVREKYPDLSPMLIHDNGSAFISRDFKFPVSQLQIQQVFTRRNHPQTNGMSQVIS